jgi:hypothetical protein
MRTHGGPAGSTKTVAVVVADDKVARSLYGGEGPVAEMV